MLITGKFVIVNNIFVCISLFVNSIEQIDRISEHFAKGLS